MKKQLYLECYAGISGDMTVAALLDLGADEKRLRRDLESLRLDGYTVEVSRVKKSGLDVCDFAVKLDEAHENHDHDMQYLHGELPEHGHAPSHEHLHDHDHGHMHHHGHSHRGLPEIKGIIEHSAMTSRAKKTALRIFDILAHAEAKAHGVPLEEVHFHEVGAVDSVVDIAAAAICLDDLGIEDVIVPVLYEGRGYVRCQHGVIPVPVPATLNIVAEHHLLLHQTETEGEFVTPTGAAIAAAIRTGERLPDAYRVEKIGLGGGKRNYERPSILRAMLIATGEGTGSEQSTCLNAGQSDRIMKMECNIDDCSGEALGYAMERLFQAGARDVYYTPIFMKKNRPAYLLTLICEPELQKIMEKILFAETTTIGIRRQLMNRTILPRQSRVMETSFGKVEVKVLDTDGQSEFVPEFESAARIAREENLPFRKVYQQIMKELSEK
ncbi:MAG: nickel pincer cofactor biosynthesis protein LarC [Clostridiales bacterium]|nr:nickel pincer cofactor biosynthesis protein LarC [Clostridiales bacterium]